MKAIPWPNGLGWEIETKLGPASVAKAMGDLIVSVPIASVQHWNEDTIRGAPRWATVRRRRIARLPLDTDPVTAVRIALRYGLIMRDDDYPLPDIPAIGKLSEEPPG